MGTTASSLSSSFPTSASQSQILPSDDITTISNPLPPSDDPLLARVKALTLSRPLLTSPPPVEAGFADILVKKNSSASDTLDPNVLLELFSVYRDWVEQKTKIISQKQEELENKMEVADALAVKLLQRFNHSVSTMRTTARNLSHVHPLEVEVGELKGRLTEVISNCNALCERISIEPEELGSSSSSIPLSITKANNQESKNHQL